MVRLPEGQKFDIKWFGQHKGATAGIIVAGVVVGVWWYRRQQAQSAQDQAQQDPMANAQGFAGGGLDPSSYADIYGGSGYGGYGYDPYGGGGYGGYPAPPYQNPQPVSPSGCPAGYVLDDYGNCLPPTSGGGSGTGTGGQTTGTVKSGPCPGGHYDASGNCVKRFGHKVCPPGWHLDSSMNCVKSEGVTCPPGYHFISGKCEPSKRATPHSGPPVSLGSRSKK